MSLSMFTTWRRAWLASIAAGIVSASCAGLPSQDEAAGGANDQRDGQIAEPAVPPVQPYHDYSYDKNSVVFSADRRHAQTVFLDTIWPFDPKLRYRHVEPLVEYRLDSAPFVRAGVLMVALADVRKLYAPYMSYTVDAQARTFTVVHHHFGKHVAGGAGSRAPTLEYTKRVHEGRYRIGERAAEVVRATHATVSNPAALAAAPVTVSDPATRVTLDASPEVRGGRIFVPVAGFLQSLGKTLTRDAASGLFALSDVDPADTRNDLFNPAFAGTFNHVPLTPARVARIDAMLRGRKAPGNFWHAVYLGEVREFTGQADAAGKDIMAQRMVDRLLPYRIYVPKGYDARVPAKFSFVLHGATGNENAPFERFNDHLVNQPTPVPGVVTLEDYADRHHFILLSPNGWTRNPRWTTGPGEQSLLAALEHARQRYSIDPKRMFITGNSAGGSGAMNVAMRYPGWFRAMAPTAPAPNRPTAAQLVGPITELPTLIACFAADVTIYYAGAPDFACQPWWQRGVKDQLRGATFVTVENGHHSYGPASLLQMTFEFFDAVLAGGPTSLGAAASTGVSAGSSSATTPRIAVGAEVRVGSTAASSIDGAGRRQAHALANAPRLQDGQLMMALDDLATLFGRTDFKVYDVHAYNNRRDDLVSVKTVLHARTSVNLRPGSRELRVGGALHAGDTNGASTRVAATDPGVDDRRFSTPPFEALGKVWVPAAEVLALFGKSVTAVAAGAAGTAGTATNAK